MLQGCILQLARLCFTYDELEDQHLSEGWLPLQIWHLIGVIMAMLTCLSMRNAVWA